jgi:hypothetical protein
LRRVTHPFPNVLVAALAAAVLLLTFPAEAAFAKSPTRSSGAKANSDPVENLGAAIVLNRLDTYSDLYHACRGSNFKAMAWALKGVESRISPPKGEFEKDLEFSDRKRKLEDAINQGHPLVVCQPLDDNEDAPFEYDADNEQFKGSFKTHQNVWRDVRRTGKYVSRTRMGVRATVTSSIDVEYDVDMDNAFRHISNDCLKSDFLTLNYEVPISRADAPALKSTGYLAFVGHLAFPFIEWSDSPGSPTLDDPEDVYERDMTVHFAPDQVAIVGPAGVRWSCPIKGE